MPSFHAVFRNSSFVIGTLLMRLSLSAPWPWSVATICFATLYILGVTGAITYFGSSSMIRRTLEHNETARFNLKFYSNFSKTR